MKKGTQKATVEPRCNEPRYNEVLGINKRLYLPQ